jgi:hypothetical protein
MRYACIGLLLLFAGCASYLPQTTGHPIAPAHD